MVHVSGRLVVHSGNNLWRYVDTGTEVARQVIDAGWDPFMPNHHTPYENEDDEPRIVGHPDNAPANSATVLSGYKNLIYSLNAFNRSAHPNLRIGIPFGVQEAIRRYVDERQAIESIWNQQQEDQTKEWP